MAINVPIHTKTADIAAQAKQLGLGVAELSAEKIAAAPTDILTLAAIESRQIFPYAFDEATTTLHVAVGNASELKKPAPAELQAQRKLGRILKLELVDPAQFSSLIPAIRERFAAATSMPAVAQPVAKPAAPAHPTVDLKSVTIPRNVLLKIPHDVATKFRVLVYEAVPGSNHVKVATDRPDDEGVKRVVSVIKEKRGVSADVASAPSEQIDLLLKEYESKHDPISLTPPLVTTSVPVTADKPGTNTDVPAAPKEKLETLPVLPVVEKLVPNAETPKIETKKSDAAPAGIPTTDVKQDAKPASTSTSISTAPAPKPSNQPADASAGNESLPVDTSPVTKKLDPAPAKIELTKPVSFTNGQSAFPLPKMPFMAAPLAKAPIAPAPLPTKPLNVEKSVNSTPTPFVNSTVPVAQTPKPEPKVIVTPIQPIQPIQVSQSPVEVKNSDVSNIASFAPMTSLDTTEEQNLDKIVGSTIQSADELETVVRTGLVPKILAAILQYAVNVGASDIHVEAEVDSLRIRFRVDGILRDMLKAPLGLDAPFVSRVKILSGMKIDEQRIPQDGRFSANTANREVDFRVSTLPAIHGEKLVLRILDKSMGVRTIDQLGMDGANAARLAAAIQKPFGIILVTGPTGSGKTTTLYAMLSTLNKPGINIVTLEDPVEYELTGITQTQVKPKIGFSFSEGLRSVLRQDPDIVMVGEIRDRETASLATHAALTGHLVLSTLHTNNAAGAIPRFLNMGVEPFLVASSIDAIIGQRLVRKLCEKCKQPANVPEAMQKDVVATLTSSAAPEVKKLATEPMNFFAPKGCAECHDGYRGRLGIYEVMTITPEIEALTSKKATLSEIQDTAVKQGMVTMKQDGIVKALSGQTSLDEIYRVTTGD